MMTSVLYSPTMDPARACPRLDLGALSQESPARPTEDSTPDWTRLPDTPKRQAIRPCYRSARMRMIPATLSLGRVRSNGTQSSASRWPATLS